MEDYIPPSGQGAVDLQQRLDLVEGGIARHKMMDPEVEFIVGVTSIGTIHTGDEMRSLVQHVKEKENPLWTS